MKEDEIYQDKIIADLFKEVPLDDCPDDFTKNVMDKVMQDWLAKPIEEKKPMNKRFLFSLILLGLILVVILLATDVRQIIHLIDIPFFNQIDGQYLQPISKSLNEMLGLMLNLPIIVYLIAISILLLGFIDKVIHYFINAQRLINS